MEEAFRFGVAWGIGWLLGYWFASARRRKKAALDGLEEKVILGMSASERIRLRRAVEWLDRRDSRG